MVSFVSLSSRWCINSDSLTLDATSAVELPKKDIPYQEALRMMQEGLAPLGDEYLAQVDNGTKDGWIDVYENQGKTSGAYSFGSYDSKPYILLNYTDTLDDAFTLAHELGHSMHSHYSNTTQDYAR